jgi:uncharacterized iron-regulated membrane protein
MANLGSWFVLLASLILFVAFTSIIVAHTLGRNVTRWWKRCSDERWLRDHKRRMLRDLEGK